MKRLLLFNLATDADDPLLGFAVGWAARLAAHYDAVDVLTMRAGRHALPPHVRVYSVGKERGYSEARRLLVFYAVLLRLLVSRRYAACFAHMMPLFALLAAPLLALARIRCTLWYTHRSSGIVLRLATRGVWRVVTAAPDSFPIRTPKRRVLGHGIDTARYAPPPARAAAVPPLLLHVARLMPIKRQAVLLHAAAALAARGIGVRAAFAGGVPPEQDAAYAARLRALAAELGIAAQVDWLGQQPPETVPALYARAAAAVNFSPPGLFDKAALEAMACAVPVFVQSAAFAPLLGEHAPLLHLPDLVDDAALGAALAERLEHLLALPDEQQAAIGAALRARVLARHSLDALIPRLVAVLETGEAPAHDHGAREVV